MFQKDKSVTAEYHNIDHFDVTFKAGPGQKQCRNFLFSSKTPLCEVSTVTNSVCPEPTYVPGNYENIVQNNLNGWGPDQGGAKTMEWSNFMTTGSQTVKLVVSTLNSGYRPFDSEMNGVQDETIGTICIQTDKKANLRFSFVDEATGKPVTVSHMYLTIYDIDQHETTTETVTFINPSATYDRLAPVGNSKLISKSTDGTAVSYTSLKYGGYEDNPKSETTLTNFQKDKSVTAEYHNIDHFDIIFKAGPGQKQCRNFLFSSKTPLCEEEEEEESEGEEEDEEETEALLAELQAAIHEKNVMYRIFFVAGFVGLTFGIVQYKFCSGKYSEGEYTTLMADEI